MKLEEKLVSLRKEKGLSQLKLAEMMNVSRQAISRWEVGAAVPSVDNLNYLGRLYNVPLEYLLNDDAEKPVCPTSDHKTEQPKEATTKRKNITLVLIITLVLFAVIFGVMYFRNQEEKPVSMDIMEGSEIETEVGFELEW